MVRKKSVKKKANRKRKVSKELGLFKEKVGKLSDIDRKIKVTLANLILFGILSGLMYFLQKNSDIKYEEIVFMGSFIFGFVSLAFLISLIVLLFLRYTRK
jgi:hypothetical protein